MKDTKYIILDAQIYDYSLIEQKLTRLASQGWHLEKAGSFAWKLRRGEPKAVRYAVTDAPTASAFNSRPTEAEEDLTDLCAQAGWVRVANVAQIHVYRNEDPNATPLETDDNERLKNIRRTMKKHFFPAEALLIGIFLMQFFMHFNTLTRYPGRTFSSPMMICTLAMCLFVALVHGILTLDGILWLRRARRAVDAGAPIPEKRFYRTFRWVIWVFLIGYLLCLLWSVGMGFLAWVLLTSGAVLLTTLGGIAVCKRLNAPRWVNMVVPAGSSALVFAVLVPLLIFSLDTSLDGELLPADDLPVTLTQLNGETGTERMILEENCTFLSSYGRYWDTGDSRLSYTIVDVKCPLLFDLLLNEQEQQFLQSAHFLTEGTIGEHAGFFDAEYARHARTELGDYWLICWDERIVNLKASWELTEDQLGILKDLLKPQ